MMAIKYFGLSFFNKAGSTMMLLVLIFFSSLAGAQKKKHLTPAEYKQWGTLELTSISPKGNYVGYNIRYESNMDTVFVMDASTKRKWAFPRGSRGKFLGNDKFLCVMPDNEVKLLYMEHADKNKILPKASRYDIITAAPGILTFDKGFGIESLMTVRNENGMLLDSIQGVTEYALSTGGSMVLYATSQTAGSKLGLIRFNPYSNTLLQSGKTSSNLSWQKNDRSLACITTNGIKDSLSEVFLYSLQSGKKEWFSIPLDQNNSKQIITQSGLRISDDGKAVFFGVSQGKEELPEKSTQKVEIWKGEDREVYPVLQEMEKWKKTRSLAVWYPSTGQHRQFASDSTSLRLLSGDHQYAITASSDSYGPYFTYYPKGNFYNTSLRTGKTVQVMKSQSVSPALLSISPTGSYMIYYREANWWLYDMKENSHRCLTGKLSTRWDNSHIPADHELVPYGVAGWSSCGNYVLLYDANDIWKINIITGKSERISRGKENKAVIRMARFEFQKHVVTNYSSDHSVPVYDLKNELLLETKNEDREFGYSVWNPKKGTSVLVLNKSMTDQCIRSENGYYAYVEQTFENPPAILFRDPVKKEPELLFASNTQHKKYLWGRSELVQYKAPDGTPLKAALFYPAGYDKDKKYPMIVEVYEINSKYLHQYVNPSQRDPMGFNIANYTHDGYFVLLPDIAYTPDETGISASECVNAAVLAAGKQGMIDMEKIGLFGHSFGGYEASFIITHSSLFAAAVSGAGVNDPVGFSFSIGKDYVKPEIWRFESQQWRMRTPFFENKDAYLRNSALYNADKIKAHLLIWCGEDDPTIPKEESIILYNALRRLGKKHRMLIYPGESHFMTEPENQADLTLRTKQWFNHYLKGSKPEKWIGDN